MELLGVGKLYVQNAELSTCNLITSSESKGRRMLEMPLVVFTDEIRIARYFNFPLHQFIFLHTLISLKTYDIYNALIRQILHYLH